MKDDPYKEYIKAKEPTKQEKSYAWNTGIGLQAVDGLKVSQYLTKVADDHINGKITFKEVNSLLSNYYRENPSLDKNDRTMEADLVSARIADLLSEKAFIFSVDELLSIHEYLFKGIYSHAGRFRDYNITKKEWVLDGDTVLYCPASEIRKSVYYDFEQEQAFSYDDLSIDQLIHHLAVFISNLWQIHPLGEGNTRTTAVFFHSLFKEVCNQCNK